MKLLINWDDMKCIIDGVEYKIKFYISFNNHIGRNIDEYIVCWQHLFYRKDNIVLEYSGGHNYYLLKLNKDDKLIVRWILHEITD